MADEVEPNDPIKAILDKHVARMNEIFTAGAAMTQELCDEGIASVKAKSGLRSQLLDKALAAMGVNQPGERVNGPTDGTITAGP